MARERRYPPKNARLAAKFIDKETGDLVLLYQPDDPTIVVRVPKGEFNGRNPFERPRRKPVA